MTSQLAPHSTVDLFADDVLADPYPCYASLREQGAAVYLDAHEVWALPRYQDVRNALQDVESFSSAGGVGLNDMINGAMAGTVLATDPPEHDRLRAVLADRLAPRGLRTLRADIERRADELVRGLTAAGDFDAVADLAQAFPLSVVIDLIGLPPEVHHKVLPWADQAFTAFGPMNERTQSAMPTIEDMLGWLFTISKDDLAPGSMGRSIFEAAERGEIGQESCVPLMMAYLVAGIDTTVNAISNAVLLFARHPEQFDLVREDSKLIPAALNEVLRFDSPVQAFTRVLRRDYPIDGVTIGDGERVVLLYGSANRDARQYTDPDVFDVNRNPVDHLSFGVGVHSCAGQGLARLEAHAIIGALARYASRLEVGEPVRHFNNVIRGLEKLPSKVVA